MVLTTLKYYIISFRALDILVFSVIFTRQFIVRGHMNEVFLCKTFNFIFKILLSQPLL